MFRSLDSRRVRNDGSWMGGGGAHAGRARRTRRGRAWSNAPSPPNVAAWQIPNLLYFALLLPVTQALEILRPPAPPRTASSPPSSPVLWKRDKPVDHGETCIIEHLMRPWQINAVLVSLDFLFIRECCEIIYLLCNRTCLALCCRKKNDNARRTRRRGWP